MFFLPDNGMKKESHMMLETASRQLRVGKKRELADLQAQTKDLEKDKQSYWFKT